MKTQSKNRSSAQPLPASPGPARARTAILLAIASLLAACATPEALLRTERPVDLLKAELAKTPAGTPATAPVNPPITPPTGGTSGAEPAATPRPGQAPGAGPSAPAAAPVAAEPRFDLIVNGAPARDVFLALVADTRYSMLMHPDVGGQLSVTLRGVTVGEALDSIRDVYGFDYRIEGRRITVFPPTMQTRIFTVNYLNAVRRGQSEVRVSGSGAPVQSPTAAGGTTTASSPQGLPDSSRITTQTHSDFWTETTEALRALLGKGEGRQVIASPHTGTIAVRAMPDEQRQVETFLRASRAALERQVMLEAKIVEVELRDGFQSGIDWSVLKRRGAIGQTSGNPSNPLLGNTGGLPTLPQAMSNLLVDAVSLPTGSGGTLGLSLAASGFEVVLGFLESQGELQVLSSPRLATLNNQKAVLKVGTDEYFVTNVSGGTVNSNNNNNNNNGQTTLPTLTLTPFFSGIALDVTPQIDDAQMITLHLRPSVTNVVERTKQIDLGAIGNYRLPLASSTVNETDTVVRVADGRIVAIGGLMQAEVQRNRSGLPGTSGSAVGRTLLGNTADSGRKKELVVLIRPTILRSDEDWQRTTSQALAGVGIAAPDDGTPRRVIALNGAGSTAAPVTASNPAVAPVTVPGVAVTPPAPATSNVTTPPAAAPAPVNTPAASVSEPKKPMAGATPSAATAAAVTPHAAASAGKVATAAVTAPAAKKASRGKPSKARHSVVRVASR